jgi:hypothetical protein
MSKEDQEAVARRVEQFCADLSRDYPQVGQVLFFMNDSTRMPPVSVWASIVKAGAKVDVSGSSQFIESALRILLKMHERLNAADGRLVEELELRASQQQAGAAPTSH